jgi:hypothetical protein
MQQQSHSCHDRRVQRAFNSILPYTYQTFDPDLKAISGRRWEGYACGENDTAETAQETRCGIKGVARGPSCATAIFAPRLAITRVHCKK